MPRKKKDYEYTTEELVNIAQGCPEFKSPAFQFYTRDFLLSDHVELMTHEEIAGYLFLLLKSWLTDDCGLPADDTILARWSRLGDRWDICGSNILARFKKIGKRYYNHRLLIERVHQVLSRQNKVKAGIESGKSRREQMLNRCTNTVGTGVEQPGEEEEVGEEEETETKGVPVNLNTPEVKAKVDW